MFNRKLHLPLLAFSVIALAACFAWAEGFGLGESKEELELKYDVKVTDHGTGRVTIVLTLEDEGRLTPLTDIQFGIPAEKPNERGSYYSDLSVSLATRKEGNKRVARVHVLKELAERAEIHLSTRHLDGKAEPLTYYFHEIPIAKYLKESGQSKKPAK
ncbi:MAG: hypothetical protein O2820_21245 [Planctomycetota bacterium]|nr:hypothetical protein [Planctomycetota bacterium]MDA1251742.1 hypothetical protein [Planctomycetota bacterium]